MKPINLREALKEIKDERRGAGQRHKIDVVLMITIMATMSGYVGYRAIGDFTKRYKKELVDYLKVEKDRLPAFATTRRVLMSIDYEMFADVFEQWIGQYLKQEKKQWVSIDGKAIKGTKQKEEDLKLAHLVSFFNSDSKEILMARKTATKSNEIPLVQEMIETFPFKDMIFTLDALHCQKKPVKLIKQSGNEYVLQVKKNQKRLLEQITLNCNVSTAISADETIEQNRGRDETRRVWVYTDLYDIDETQWVGIKQLVKVERVTFTHKKILPSIDVSYYISSIETSASQYNKGIRSHWAIENSLHYVKDVTFHEDASRIRTGNAPTNFSIIRNIAINVLRRMNFNSFPQAIRMVGGDIPRLFQALE